MPLMQVVPLQHGCPAPPHGSHIVVVMLHVKFGPQVLPVQHGCVLAPHVVWQIPPAQIPPRGHTAPGQHGCIAAPHAKHEPPLQTCVPLSHNMPPIPAQPPQFALSVCVLTHVPPQFVCPAPQHRPLLHVWPPVQVIPHPPQCVVLVCVLVSHPLVTLLSQLPKPVLHVIRHALLMHDGVPLTAEQPLPHIPQWAALVVVSVERVDGTAVVLADEVMAVSATAEADCAAAFPLLLSRSPFENRKEMSSCRFLQRAK